MNNTHALLLAFIEASGFEVEEVVSYPGFGEAINEHGNASLDDKLAGNARAPYILDFKVTEFKFTKNGENKRACPLCNGKKGLHKFKTFVECPYCDGSGKVENI